LRRIRWPVPTRAPPTDACRSHRTPNRTVSTMNRPTTLDADGYVHSTCPHTGDPLALATAIAASSQLTDFVVYEQPGRWYVAGNPVGAITVGPDRVRSTLGGDHTESWS